MAIYNFQKSDFIYMVPPAGNAALTGQSLAYTLWSEMTSHGFKVIDTDNPGAALSASTLKIILEAKPEVDPLITSSPWRIYMEVYGSASVPTLKTDDKGVTTTVNTTISNTGLRFAVGTPEQITDKVATAVTSGLQFYPIVPEKNLATGTSNTQPRAWDSSTMSVSLTTAARGVAIACWMNDITNDFEYTGVVCIQRGVSCGGAIDQGATGQKPLFMVTNVSPLTVNTGNTDNSQPGPHSAWYYQVVREVDTIVSAPQWVAGSSQVTDGAYQYFNTTIGDEQERRGTILYRYPTKWLAPVISDTNQYHLLFPFGLCTSRFAYSEELDLIAVSKADAYRTGQQVPLNVYGESGDRLYTALTSNSKNNSNSGGIRLFMLASGPNA